jgi:hypothetical protein
MLARDGHCLGADAGEKIRAVQASSFRTAVGAMLVLVALGASSSSRAEGGMSAEARAAYDRGTAAHARGDYRAAAGELAEADALAPNLVALKAALDEALLADDPELGMQLVDRAHARAPGDASLASSVHDAETRFAARIGRMRVDCGGRPCTASIDGRRVAAASSNILLPGPHRVVIEREGASITRDVDVAAAREIDVVLPPGAVGPPSLAAAPSSYPAVPRERGVSPTAWFLTAAGLTAIAGAATIVSGVDTASQHSGFVSRGCEDAAAAGCGALASSGANAETRTNVLLAVTGGLGVTSLVLAFFVPWHARPDDRAALIFGDRTASLRLRF